MYARARLAICRAGATSIAELIATGTPSVLVPLATSAGGHQLENARELETAGAARTSVAGRHARALYDVARLAALEVRVELAAVVDAEDPVPDRELTTAGPREREVLVVKDVVVVGLFFPDKARQMSMPAKSTSDKYASYGHVG